MSNCKHSFEVRTCPGRKPVCIHIGKSKVIAITVWLAMVFQIIYPNVCIAVTGGPASPEFSSFEPVATTNMVNEFTGQFIYNLPVLEIPGASGGGYALSLAYHSGDGPESEASWVGNGWTLNPGSIIRNKRGVPDDYKGQSIKYYNSAPKNWTIAATGSIGGEAYSITGSLSGTIRYNYYKGYGLGAGLGLSALKGLFSINYGISDGTGSFSVGINPAALLGYVNNGQKSDMENAYAQMGCEYGKKNNSGIGLAAVSGALRYSGAGAALSTGLSSYVNHLLTSSTSPYNLTPYSGKSISGYVQLTEDPGPVPVGLNEGVDISYTSQENESPRTIQSYGYMYAGNNIRVDTVDSTGNTIMDYTIENASTYSMREKYLPVPTSTPDVYMVSGEGLSGAFRMYNDRIGIFSPNFVESKTKTERFGADVHLGLDVGIGADVTTHAGQHSLKVRSAWSDGDTSFANGNTDSLWFVPYNYRDTSNIESENMFFRFSNDMGGSINYDDDVVPQPIAPAISGKAPNLTQRLYIRKDTTIPGHSNRRTGRSSYIGYHTNREINTFSGTMRPLAYEQRADINSLAGRGDTVHNRLIDDEIGEVSVANEGGNRYTYGLPVYNGQERNLRRGLTGISGAADEYLVHSALGSMDHGITIGEEYTAPYVSQYLLTEITTPDYLDINGNGPDEADFGGYTKFSYERYLGSNDKVTTSGYANWYKWRCPYNGMVYVPNRLSDNTDDMGSYQSGYKEVYYLDTIQTKTHFAVFITNSRIDGIDANSSDETAASSNVQGSHSPKYLDRIELYAKSTTGGAGKLIKTIHFEYNYDCWPGNVNTSGGTYGKLTLKKVWFEYNGVTSARISPYQFEYSYPTGVTYPSAYSGILSEMTASGSLVQNPNYTPYIDCWGNYQDSGYARRQLMKTGVSQAPSASFDPAAWQLKRIILPSGGEIHVQYEQNTYSYVQDRNACSLVSIDDNDRNVASSNKYPINCAELGANTDIEKDSLVSLIKKTYKDQKIFFKFYYTLVGLSTAPFGNCNGDYVEGYVNFTDCYRVSSGPSAKVYVEVGDLPREVCKDYIKKQVGGKLLDGACAGASTFPGDAGLGSVESALRSLVTTFIKKVYSGLPGANICMRAKGNVSYLRIPVLKKLGGGVRVKRLLMYNKGIDVSAPTLYGTQYIYDNESNGTSYGVATNEPFENKGENPLVTFLPKRDEMTDWNKLIAGKDKEQFEGPLSWNALPAPSIGYSRVIKKNIHQTQTTTTGYTVQDYYTAKDYPYDAFYPYLGVKGAAVSPINKHEDKMDMDYRIFSYDVKTGMRASQGYCFIQNQMHGQIRQVSDYRGAYSAATFYDITHPPVPVSQKTYSYFEPGEKVPMYDFNKWATYYDMPGKETDITIDRRCVLEHSLEAVTTGDITVGVAGFFAMLWSIGFPVTSMCDQDMNSIVVNKVVHYPAIMKSMSVMKDGYYQTSSYDAFDPLTGKPVLTSTFDGYHGINLPLDNGGVHNGQYTAYNVPASACYTEMGQKARNERYYYYNNTGITVTGSGTSYTVSGVNVNGVFTPGDLIALHYHLSGSTYDGVAIAHVTSVSGSNIVVAPTTKYNTTLPGSGYFKAEVIQSGYTNQLSSSMDGFTTYGGKSGSLTEFLARLNYLISQVQYTSANNLYLYLDNYALNIEFNPGEVVPSDTPCSRSRLINKLRIYRSAGTVNVDLYIPYFGSVSALAFVYPQPVSGPPMIVTSGATWHDFACNGTGAKPYVCDTDIHLKIIKAQSTTYADKWIYDTAYGLDTSVLNRYESGMRGKWRPFETYVYRDSTKRGSDIHTDQRNYYNAGTAPFYLGRWDTIYKMYPERWIRSNHIELYSPNGHATQEYDAENVYSAAKYGYHGFLPYIVAQNAQTGSVRFESFENVYPNSTSTGHWAEDHMTVIQSRVMDVPHSGHKGYLAGQNQIVDIPNTIDITGHGLTLRFWAKVSGNPLSDITVTSSASGGLAVTQIARSGDWALYESVWSGGMGVTSAFTIKNVSTHEYYFDDIRLAPTDAKSTSYVYDIGTYKLSAVLDDQNFATYYQYNGEGKLVRTLVETARGIKTVEESQYHLPTVPHP